jgi:1-acyl-sn-glycerol-3-phosphate acyltransferase
VIARLRFLRRLLLALPVTLIAYGWAAIASILLRPWPQRRARQQGKAFRFWSRGLCRVFGIRVRVAGTPPSPPFFLVSNHVSYIDIIVLGTAVPCVFVAKAEIDRWPIFGALCRSVNTIFIDRRAKRELPRVMAEIGTTLGAGQGVVIFPEGTSWAGDRVLPFRSPLLDLPARMGYPVHHATLGYEAPRAGVPLHLSISWWGEMPLGAHLAELLRVPRIEAKVSFGAAPVADSDRKRLADRLWSAVAERFAPLVDSAEIERLLALRENDPERLPALLRPRGRGLS